MNEDYMQSIDAGLERAADFLQKKLGCYDRILYFKKKKLLTEFCSSEAFKAIKRRLLVLSQEKCDMQMDNIAFAQITRDVAECIERLYHMYRFSERFIFIAEESGNYASMFQFADSDILDREQIFEALLADCMD